MTINIDNIENEIRQAKSQIRSAGGDLRKAFATIDSVIDEQIAEIEQIVAGGGSPIPVTSLAELDSQDKAFHDLVRRRGCVIVRNVFSEDRVNDWNDTLMSYVRENGYFKKQAEKVGMDKYFSELASGKPQILGLYWSRPQMEARTSQEMAKVRSWLNHLWTFHSQNGTEFDPDLECLYADRLRQREPGDRTLGLSPHAVSYTHLTLPTILLV